MLALIGAVIIISGLLSGLIERSGLGSGSLTPDKQHHIHDADLLELKRKREAEPGVSNPRVV